MTKLRVLVLCFSYFLDKVRNLLLSSTSSKQNMSSELKPERGHLAHIKIAQTEICTKLYQKYVQLWLRNQCSYLCWIVA